MRLKRTSVDWHSPFKMYTMYMLTGMGIRSEFFVFNGKNHFLSPYRGSSATFRVEIGYTVATKRVTSGVLVHPAQSLHGLYGGF